MTDYCDYSDLPVDTCSHCTGADLRDAQSGYLPPRWVGSETEAQHPGVCAHCETRFPAGTLIAAADVQGNGVSDSWCLLEHTTAVR